MRYFLVLIAVVLFHSPQPTQSRMLQGEVCTVENFDEACCQGSLLNTCSTRPSQSYCTGCNNISLHATQSSGCAKTLNCTQRTNESCCKNKPGCLWENNACKDNPPAQCAWSGGECGVCDNTNGCKACEAGELLEVGERDSTLGVKVCKTKFTLPNTQTAEGECFRHDSNAQVTQPISGNCSFRCDSNGKAHFVSHQCKSKHCPKMFDKGCLLYGDGTPYSYSSASRESWKMQRRIMGTYTRSHGGVSGFCLGPFYKGTCEYRCRYGDWEQVSNTCRNFTEEYCKLNNGHYYLKTWEIAKSILTSKGGAPGTSSCPSGTGFDVYTCQGNNQWTCAKSGIVLSETEIRNNYRYRYLGIYKLPEWSLTYSGKLEYDRR